MIADLEHEWGLDLAREVSRFLTRVVSPIWLEKRAGCEHECRSRVGEISQPALSMNENTYFARK